MEPLRQPFTEPEIVKHEETLAEATNGIIVGSGADDICEYPR
jgi:hypothetical protein